MNLADDELGWPTKSLPEITTAGRFPLNDRAFATQYRSETHALHVHDYDATLRLGDRVIPLRPGDVTLTPARMISSYALPRAGNHWCVHFQPATGRATGGVAPIKMHLPLGSLGQHAGQRIMAIAQVFAGPADPIASAAASAAMLELLLWLSLQARVARRTGGASRGVEAAERAASLIYERLAHELSIEALAEEVGLTQNYLARLFRLRYGTTMPHFLLRSRVDHARHLLRHTALPIAAIAARAGMPDPQHFNKQFRRLTGMSPSAYRAGSVG